MNDYSIAFFDTKPFDRRSFEQVNRKHGFHIKYYKHHLNPDTANLRIGFDAVCVFVNDIITADVVDMLVETNVKVIALRCAGYNNIDFKAAYGKIHVVRVPEYSPYAVAEHAVALMMTLNRKTHRAYYRTRDNNFNISGLLGFDMYQKTAGVVGTGKIGKILTGILNGFGMRVLAYDPYPDREFEASGGVEYVSLEQLYAQSDIISLNCPLTDETYHMINSDSIESMKDGVMIINTGRGHLIDTGALIKGLKSEKISAAGLDVYEEESAYFFQDHSDQIVNDDILARLLTFNNVLVTSHQGFFTSEAITNIAEVTLGNISGFFAGEILENEICYKCESGKCKRQEGKRCF